MAPLVAISVWLYPLGKTTMFFLAPSSYLAIVIVLIMTGAGLPLPEEVPIVAAGILSANGTLVPLWAFACCLFGAVVGDCAMYWIGYHFGRGVLKDHRWWSRFVTPEREAQIEVEFRRHGLKVFFVARFLVGVRSPVYLTAGILRVSFRRFVLIDLICATAVVGTFFWLTYLFGKNIAEWVREFEVLATVVAVIVLASVGFYFWRRHCQKMAAASKCPGQESPALPEPETGHEDAEGAETITKRSAVERSLRTQREDSVVN